MSISGISGANPHYPAIDKEKLAANLKKVSTDYNEHVPFSKKKGIVSSVIYSFDKMVHKAFGKTPPMSFSEIELRFAMHLFRNFDQEALDLAYFSKAETMKGLEDQIPFSAVLKVWSHFLGSMPELKQEIDLEGLKKCASYQKKIEGARISWKWKQKAQMRSLAKKIARDLDNLEPGQKRYIPGGALIVSGDKREVHQMVYECKRDTKDPEKILFSIVNLSADHLETFTIPKEKLKDSLENLIHVQTVPASTPLKMELASVLKAWIRIKLGMVSRGPKGAEGLKKILGSHLKVEGSTDPEKVYEVFQKTFQGNSAKEHKLLLKTALFFHIYETSKHRLSDPAWNKWMQDNAIQLLNSIDGMLGDFESAELKEKFEVIIEELQRTQKKKKKALLPKEPKGADPSFKESPLAFDHKISLEKVKEMKSDRIAAPETSVPLTLSDFQAKIEELQKLSTLQKLEEMQEPLEILFLAIQRSEFQATDAVQWSRVVSEMLHFKMQIHLGLQQGQTLPRELFQMIKSLEIMQKLAHLNTDFTGYALDMSVYKTILRDPYLDLGSYGPQIMKSIANIEQEGAIKLNMERIVPDQMTDEEKEFYKKFLEKHPEIDPKPDITFLSVPVYTTPIPTKITADFGQENLLPEQIAQLKKAAVMTQVMMAPYRTLNVPGIGHAFTEPFKVGRAALKERTKGQLFEEVTFERHQKHLDKQLQKKKKPAEFTAKLDGVYVSLKLEPYGLRFREFDGPFLTGQSVKDYIKTVPLFDKTGMQIRNPDIGKNVIEREYQEERSVLENRQSIAGLPLDVSSELRLMGASPEGLKIPLTLGFFIKHPSLLTDPKVGTDMQRVFRLNLFRANTLGLKLEKEPEYAAPFVRDLEKLLFQMEATSDISGVIFLSEVIEDCRNIFLKTEGIDLEKIEEICDKNFSRLKGKEGYYAFLHHFQGRLEDVTPSDLKAILTTYVLLQQMPRYANEINRTKDDQVQQLMRQLQPQLKVLLEKDRNTILSAITGKNGIFEPAPHLPLYRSGEMEVDVSKGLIFQNHAAKSFLPSKIAGSSICKGIFGEEALYQTSAVLKIVHLDKEAGEQYEFPLKNIPYKILSFSGKDPVIFRKDKEGKWLQLHFASSEAEEKAPKMGLLQLFTKGIDVDELSKEEKSRGPLPQIVREMPCWIDPDGKKFQIEDWKGKVLFEGTLGSKGVTDLWDVQKNAQVLNPWKNPAYKNFSVLDDPQHILCTESGIYYQRHPLEYRWKENKWQCVNFEGYTLSDKTLDNFQDYQLLEHPTKNPRLLLSGDRYEPNVPKNLGKQPIKYRRDSVQKVSSEVPTLYSFEVDPVQGLKSETEEGYLYLAYALLTQKKYAESVFYLRKAADVKVQKSDEAKKIIHWLTEWKDPSIEALAVQMHLKMITKSFDLEKIIRFQQAVEAGLIDPALDFSPSQKHFIKEMFLGQTEIELLEKQIEENAKQLKPLETKEFPTYEKSIFFDVMAPYLQDKSVSQEELQVWKEKIQNLKAAFKIGEIVPEEAQFQQELGQELVDDMQYALDAAFAPSKELKPNADLKQIIKTLDEQKRDHLEKSLKLQSKIIDHMHFPVSKNAFGSMAKKLEQLEMMKTRYFEEALYCAASNDWRPLLDAGIIEKGQEGELTELVEEFLIHATAAAQFQKAYDFALQPPSDSILQQFQDLLNAHRHFDPKQDPYRLPILLMEYYSKNIAFKSQVQNIRDMFSETNLFKHEALAAGKTTFLRNIISKIKADGVTLSGVMTHEPLFNQHHPLYEKTTRGAYGEKVFHLSFSRSSPSDVKSLTHIYRSLLETIAEKGRISTTRSDVLSLRNHLLQKYDEFWKGKGDPSEEIDILCDIFILLKEKGSIGNDELEKILASDNENNYTAGDSKGALNPVKSKAALKLVEWILKDPHYRRVFQANQHSKMTAEQVDQFLASMAQKVHAEYFPNADLNQTIQYLTGISKGMSYEEEMQFYKENVDHNELLSAFRKHLHEVIKGSFAREGGDGYKRVDGGIEVKPAHDGEINLKSEFGTEEETIWFTCLTYMDQTLGGVTTELMGRIANEAKDKALAELTEMLRNDPSARANIGSTPSYKRFHKQFGLDLLNVTPSDQKQMAEGVNQNPKQLVKVLRNYVLPHYIVSTEKIVSNSQDLSLTFDEFYGSSGTSNNWRALPDAIKKQPHLVKQKGVDGVVLVRLYKDFVPEDMICLDPTKDQAPQIGELLKQNKGSAFIDLGPFFPGKSSKEIGSSLMPHLASDQPVRMLLAEGEGSDVEVKLASGVKAPQNVKVDDMVTIIAKTNCRGTNLVMRNEAVGFVTIGPQTTATDFWQAVMRMRKLGKGQKVRFILDPAVQKILGQRPSLGELIAFLEGNEAHGLKNRSHLKGEKQKITAIGKEAAFNELIRKKDHKSRMEAQIFRPFFFKQTQETLESCGIPKRMRDTSSIVTDLALQERALLQKLPPTEEIQKAIAQLNDKIEGKNRIAPKYLPSLSVDSPHELGLEQENEQEQEQEQQLAVETEVEQEQEIQDREITGGYPYREEAINSKAQLVDHYLAKENDFMRPLHPFYDPHFKMTENLFPGTTKPWGLEGAQERIKNQTMVFNVMLVVDKRQVPETTYSMVGTIRDYDTLFKGLDVEDNTGIDIYSLNLQTGNFDGRLSELKEYPEEVQKHLAKAIVQAKFFAGEVDLIRPSEKGSLVRDEATAFKQWLETLDKDTVALMETNLKKYLAEYKPSTYKTYQKSEMARIFREV